MSSLNVVIDTAAPMGDQMKGMVQTGAFWLTLVIILIVIWIIKWLIDYFFGSASILQKMTTMTVGSKSLPNDGDDSDDDEYDGPNVGEQLAMVGDTVTYAPSALMVPGSAALTSVDADSLRDYIIKHQITAEDLQRLIIEKAGYAPDPNDIPERTTYAPLTIAPDSRYVYLPSTQTYVLPYEYLNFSLPYDRWMYYYYPEYYGSYYSTYWPFTSWPYYWGGYGGFNRNYRYYHNYRPYRRGYGRYHRGHSRSRSPGRSGRVHSRSRSPSGGITRGYLQAGRSGGGRSGGGRSGGRR